MDVATFLRALPLRAPRIMWFLGAGASAGAGVPTAGHLIWRLKGDLTAPHSGCPHPPWAIWLMNAARPGFKRSLESQPGMPLRGSDEEYSYLFEAAYPREEDRRVAIDRAISGAAPSRP